VATPTKPQAESEADIKRAVSINVEALATEYAELPSTLSRWTARRVAAREAQHLAEVEQKAAVERAELDLEVGEQKIRLQKRKEDAEAVEAARAGGDAKAKSATVDEIEARVKTDPEFRKLRESVIDTIEKHGKLVAAATKKAGEALAMVDVLDAKRDMLVSLGADIRADRGADPSLRGERPRR